MHHAQSSNSVTPEQSVPTSENIICRKTVIHYTTGGAVIQINWIVRKYESWMHVTLSTGKNIIYIYRMYNSLLKLSFRKIWISELNYKKLWIIRRIYIVLQERLIILIELSICKVVLPACSRKTVDHLSWSFSSWHLTKPFLGPKFPDILVE